MRPVKYRAWDGEKLHYFDPMECMVKMGIHIECAQDCIEPSIDEGSLAYDSFKIADLVLGLTVTKVMQWTGLVDKHGNDIYEGDIINFKNTMDPVDNIYHGLPQEVKYNKNFCGFEPFCEYDSDCCEFVRLDSVEVIGNILEDPEMIK